MTNFSHSPPQPRTYYTLLGIDQDANPKEIEKAYKRQALVHHPDRNPNDSQTQSTNMFQKLAEAYEILRDPVKRRKYDIKVANTIALNADPSTAHARSSHGNVYPNRPASQQSNRPTNHSKRSSAYDLFAYPGEIPQYVPTPNRRPASTAPAFRPRAGSSAEPMTSTSKNLQRQPTAVHPESHQPKPVQKPFTQKINLKDLDSLDFILNMGLHPQSQNKRLNSSSAGSRVQARPTLEATKSLHPTQPRDISCSAPDPYLTFQRAWGQSLDGIVDRETDHRRYHSRKSNTDPISVDTKPRNVHRSATVRSADSDFRASSFDHQRRPRSAVGGDAFRDWLPTPNCTSPQQVSNRPSKESRSGLDEDEIYLPSSYQPRNRRLSTGNEKLYQPTQPHTQPRLYRQASNTGISTNSASSIRGGSGVRSSNSPGSSSSTNSPTDYPSPSHPLMPNSRRSRSSTMTPEYPVENPPNQGLSREFREVIIRFERERDGSTRMSKEIKSRTIDLDGTVHDRYRRQRAAAVK
ncbi:hypothetical protein MJO28_001935 [Puccinia striiformis f. sp. tritici]|uniref:J domain-containing protein n=3 Tax=Puccinia striiformis TaxID=27350 RepID=A0A0L0VUJ1_9BASI|nr:hypothetical protein Pst134EB_003919 [Puccinia striiformis f. sp. tritici]KAI9628010.1 hypothetical protein KEM48_011857 [Puccinia striiformis f. sp. tritici PST-130]KNF02882.1 hypothetical protein PSTG_03828 [Puccinia striiformis f. sp. tritici PST-78]POW14161.1 hypothetical protein PSTT_03224 [Puccinia striiformis]KAI7961446.1 hypothetical protein MJO28_001935 [Puccinia striiformis f. sp. tritici]